MRIGAIVLSGGTGKRMKTTKPKQYLELRGKPLIAYTLQAFEECQEIQEVVLVTGAGDVAYGQTEIVEKYGFRKVTTVVPGGKERYDSVYQGLCALENCSHVLIHDGARPFVSQKILREIVAAVLESRACISAVQVKDTIKVVREEQGQYWIQSTPVRSSLWNAQTPQAFQYELVRSAYEQLRQTPMEHVTDDAMVVASYGQVSSRIVPGEYTNIKITTPEDLVLAEQILQAREEETGAGK